MRSPVVLCEAFATVGPICMIVIAPRGSGPMDDNTIFELTAVGCFLATAFLVIRLLPASRKGSSATDRQGNPLPDGDGGSSGDGGDSGGDGGGGGD